MEEEILTKLMELEGDYIHEWNVLAKNMFYIRKVMNLLFQPRILYGNLLSVASSERLDNTDVFQANCLSYSSL